MDWYVDRFEREYKMARDEFLRLSALFKDVCWYNFETVNLQLPRQPCDAARDAVSSALAAGLSYGARHLPDVL